MSEDTTTTEAPVADGGAAPVDSATSQPDTTEQATAEVSSNEQNTEQQTNKMPSEDDVKAWAEKKGFDLNNPEHVAKLATSYREAEKKMHESSQQASELKNVINDEAQSMGIPDNELAALQQQMQIIQAERQVENFYAQKPDARKYDAEMAEIVRENPQAAAAGIEALYAMAKVRALENGGTEQIKSEGKKEALQDLALKQKVAATTGAAVQQSSTSAGITREDVQRALANHDVSWLREHEAEISAL